MYCVFFGIKNWIIVKVHKARDSNLKNWKHFLWSTEIVEQQQQRKKIFHIFQPCKQHRLQLIFSAFYWIKGVVTELFSSFINCCFSVHCRGCCCQHQTTKNWVCLLKSKEFCLTIAYFGSIDTFWWKHFICLIDFPTKQRRQIWMRQQYFAQIPYSNCELIVE